MLIVHSICTSTQRDMESRRLISLNEVLGHPSAINSLMQYQGLCYAASRGKPKLSYKDHVATPPWRTPSTFTYGARVQSHTFVHISEEDRMRAYSRERIKVQRTIEHGIYITAVLLHPLLLNAGIRSIRHVRRFPLLRRQALVLAAAGENKVTRERQS